MYLFDACYERLIDTYRSINLKRVHTMELVKLDYPQIFRRMTILFEDGSQPVLYENSKWYCLVFYNRRNQTHILYPKNKA
jgi:hypothetical protein